jgi:steroid delta-isomerase-like uncharacterized protein
MQTSNANFNVVQRFYDAYNDKDAAILNEVIADEYVDFGHEPPGRGIAGAKMDQQEIARAFGDARFDIDELIGSDDRVVASWTLHATHTGPFAGLSPTGKKVAFRGISVYRLHDGKITETRNLPDLLGLFIQLDAIERKRKPS